VSKTVPGTVHDFRSEPPETHILADSGYQGILNIHKNSETLKPKNGVLTKEE
jgi:hypothetical protein